MDRTMLAFSGTLPLRISYRDANTWAERDYGDYIRDSVRHTL